MVLAIWLAAPGLGASQVPEELAPADAFLDSGAAALVERAYAGRSDAVSGLASYEARFTERMRVGVQLGGRLPFRDRTFYHREKVGRARWSVGGDHIVKWLGRRSGSPTFGDSWIEGRAPFNIDFNPEEDMDLDELGAIEFFDPMGDRLDFFGVEFIQPISNEGMGTYRFASGDTLQLNLRAPDRSVELVEVTVTPRYESWETVEGSLWFDLATGVLVRAVYRPTAAYDLMEQGDLDGVPAFARPARGTVEHIVVEYALYEQRWWLPRRVMGEGTFRWGNVLRMPLQMEWSMSDYIVNEAPSSAVAPGPDDVRVGADRNRRNRTDRTDHYAPRGLDLSTSPELPDPIRPDGPLNFSAEELAPLLSRLDEVGARRLAATYFGWRRELVEGLRYNRIQALSVGYTFPFGVGGWGDGLVRGRVGAAALAPSASARLNNGAWSLSAYSRLVDAGDFSDGLGVENSLGAFLFGEDDGEYYRASGGRLAMALGGARGGFLLAAFIERQRSLSQRTGFSLASPSGGGFRPNLVADSVDIGGLAMAAWKQWGDDVQVGVLHLRAWGELGVRDVEYRRGAVGIRAAGPLAGLSGAVELAAGFASSETPAQRAFFVGGTRSLRGFSGGASTGNSFWLARFEAASDLAGLRGLGFVDLGWAGARQHFPHSQARAAVGAGLSVMDGLFRVDLSKGISRGGTWRLHFYSDGMF